MHRPRCALHNQRINVIFRIIDDGVCCIGPEFYIEMCIDIIAWQGIEDIILLDFDFFLLRKLKSITMCNCQ